MLLSGLLHTSLLDNELKYINDGDLPNEIVNAHNKPMTAPTNNDTSSWKNE